MASLTPSRGAPIHTTDTLATQKVTFTERGTFNMQGKASIRHRARFHAPSTLASAHPLPSRRGPHVVRRACDICLVQRTFMAPDVSGALHRTKKVIIMPVFDGLKGRVLHNTM
jgi:hypothetical protein